MLKLIFSQVWYQLPFILTIILFIPHSVYFDDITSGTLIDFYDTVDLPHEPETGKETNRSYLIQFYNLSFKNE